MAGTTKTVVFDFDGVINSYKSGWTGEGVDVIVDEPVAGIKEVIDELRQRGYEVAIVSSRCQEQKGIDAINSWLNLYNIKVDKVCATKLPAIVYVDDRAINFNGKTEGLVEKICTFRSWTEPQSNSKFKDILDRFNHEGTKYIVGTMYGGKYPQDKLTIISKDQLQLSKNCDSLLYVWAYPGPDYNEYRFEDYGLTWAFTPEDVYNSEN